MKKLYTAKELAKIFDMSAKTVYNAGKRGEIETYRIGKSVRFAMPERIGGQSNDKATTEDN